MIYDESKKKLISYLKWALISVSLVVVMYFIESPTASDGAKVIVAKISNCFFVPGAMITCLALLTFLASLGAYDSFAYIFSNFALHSLFYRNQPKKYESLYDYKEKKDQKGRSWSKPMLFVGLGTVLISVILYVVYAIL